MILHFERITLVMIAICVTWIIISTINFIITPDSEVNLRIYNNYVEELTKIGLFESDEFEDIESTHKYFIDNYTMKEFKVYIAQATKERLGQYMLKDLSLYEEFWLWFYENGYHLYEEK
jgi:hypothetical protein